MKCQSLGKLKSISRKLGFITVCVALVVQMLFINVNAQQKKRVVEQPAQPAQDDTPQIQSISIQIVSKTVVNVRTLASSSPASATKNANQKAAKPPVQTQTLQSMPVPGSITEVDPPSAPSANSSSLVSEPDVPQPLAPSPGPSQNFQAAIDEAVGGGPSGTFTIPPDTMGAVGLNKIISFVNNNLVVQDKATGSVLSLVGITSFFSSTGATGVFDPRVLYDPYNNRWLLAATSKAQTANSSVIVGVSDSPDP